MSNLPEDERTSLEPDSGWHKAQSAAKTEDGLAQAMIVAFWLAVIIGLATLYVHGLVTMVEALWRLW